MGNVSWAVGWFSKVTGGKLAYMGCEQCGRPGTLTADWRSGCLMCLCVTNWLHRVPGYIWLLFAAVALPSFIGAVQHPCGSSVSLPVVGDSGAGVWVLSACVAQGRLRLSGGLCVNMLHRQVMQLQSKLPTNHAHRDSHG